MPAFFDTICALATPVGTSAIALVRVSGPEASRLAREIAGETPLPRFVRHCDYRDAAGALVDDVLVTYFAGPNSYTGEDSLEISCHGNPFVAQKIVEDLLARGCRAAGPGEFTQRAFLHGRMDLSQAEAVMDLIHARSERALEAAHRQLRGALGRRLAALMDGLVAALARVEAYIDFPEEDLPPEDVNLVRSAIEHALRNTDDLLATGRYGEVLRRGIRAVILGAPNAGKSSLLNRLVGRDRALVSPEAGTTRDYIEEPVLIGPHLFRFVDTAGLNPTPGPLEALGIQKTAEMAATADVALWVIDAAAPNAEPASLALEPGSFSKSGVVIINKIDLVSLSRPPLPAALESLPVVSISALDGRGLDELRTALVQIAERFAPQVGPDAVAINARHSEALRRGRGALAEASLKLGSRGLSTELLASDLRDALDAFGEIGGKMDNEQVLDRLFREFCIGK